MKQVLHEEKCNTCFLFAKNKKRVIIYACTITQKKRGEKMAVTMQQIADLAGVSRGTVDRALNNRGRIRPEVAEKIKMIAKELGYQPNIAAKALSSGNQILRIGVILQYADTPTIQTVLEGAKDAKQEVERFGGRVMIDQIKGGDVRQVLDIMRGYKEAGMKGIVLMPSNDEMLKNTINRYVDDGIEIITINSDLEDTKRRCFVGQDNYAGGCVAGGLMGEIIPDGGKVMIISGSADNTATVKRTKGFIAELSYHYPSIKILEPRFAYDDNWVAGKLLEEQLEITPDLKGIYMPAQGEIGVCKILKKYELEKKIKLIVHDYEGENKKNLKEGVIDFVLRQDAYAQGYESVMEIFHSLCGNPGHKEEFCYKDIVIKTRCNL